MNFLKDTIEKLRNELDSKDVEIESIVHEAKRDSIREIQSLKESSLRLRESVDLTG